MVVLIAIIIVLLSIVVVAGIENGWAELLIDGGLLGLAICGVLGIAWQIWEEFLSRFVQFGG